MAYRGSYIKRFGDLSRFSTESKLSSPTLPKVYFPCSYDIAEQTLVFFYNLFCSQEIVLFVHSLILPRLLLFYLSCDAKNRSKNNLFLRLIQALHPHIKIGWKKRPRTNFLSEKRWVCRTIFILWNGYFARVMRDEVSILWLKLLRLSLVWFHWRKIFGVYRQPSLLLSFFEFQFFFFSQFSFSTVAQVFRVVHEDFSKSLLQILVFSVI